MITLWWSCWSCLILIRNFTPQFMPHYSLNRGDLILGVWSTFYSRIKSRNLYLFSTFYPRLNNNIRNVLLCFNLKVNIKWKFSRMASNEISIKTSKDKDCKIVHFYKYYFNPPINKDGSKRYVCEKSNFSSFLTYVEII